MKSKELIVYVLILNYLDVFSFLGSTLLLQLLHYFTLAIGMLGFIRVCKRSKFNALTYFVLLFAFFYPFYSGVCAHNVFGQSYVMGWASMRYVWVILVGLYLYSINYDYSVLLSQINKVNLCIAIVFSILLYVFHVDQTIIQHWMTSTNAIEIEFGADEVKGAKIGVCANLMIVTYVYYMLKCLNNLKNKKNILIFLVLMFYLLFVHKGRQPIAMLGVVYIVYFLSMKKLSAKKILYALLPFGAYMFLVAYNTTMIDSLLEAAAGANSIDSSTLARAVSVASVEPYIAKYPIFGFGNLSVHFGLDGFHTYFGNEFYLSDIGIYGAIARGGIVLVLIYLGLYVCAFIYSGRFQQPAFYKQFMRYMLLAQIVGLTVLMSDSLCDDGSLMFALLFYPFFTGKIPSHKVNNIISRK